MNDSKSRDKEIIYKLIGIKVQPTSNIGLSGFSNSFKGARSRILQLL